VTRKKILKKTKKLGKKLTWVTNLNEDRKRFFLIASLLDPRTKSLSFCDDKHFPTSWKHEGHGFLAMESKSFDSEIQDTQVDVLE
jgi:hypothetical protein